MARVVIEPYSESWRGDFARVARRLRAALGERALRIDPADLADANPLGAAGFEELAPVTEAASRG